MAELVCSSVGREYLAPSDGGGSVGASSSMAGRRAPPSVEDGRASWASSKLLVLKVLPDARWSLGKLLGCVLLTDGPVLKTSSWGSMSSIGGPEVQLWKQIPSSDKLWRLKK